MPQRKDMSKIIKIKRGLDIKMRGEAMLTIEEVHPTSVAIQPTDFIGVTPRLLVQEGASVELGTPLFQDKHDERILFCSPVAGVVKEIRRGEKRRLEAVVVEPSLCADASTQEKFNFEAKPQTREEIIALMLANGLWPFVRQRPYSTIANPDQMPKAFWISGFDTAPLAPNIDFIVEQAPQSFQKGLDVLSILSGGNVHLGIKSGEKGTQSTALLKAKNVEIHLFEGPHPVGNISTQINKICPISKGEVIWYCSPQDVITIGHYFLTGELDFTRTYAFAGTSVIQPHYYRTCLGTSVGNICNVTDHTRLISGNVLTGKKVSENDFIGFYDTMLTAIPEGDNRQEIFGWMWPGFKKLSFSRTYPSAFVPSFLKPRVELDTNMHGEERPYVMTGEFEKIFPFDIYPLQLIKACIVEDIDLMEALGIYEVDAEDFALCEFIDTSKTNIQEIIRKGLELLRKENEGG